MLLSNYYLINLFIAVSYVSAALVYLGRFNSMDQRTIAYQRLLLGVVSWAFFDFVIDHLAGSAGQETAFLWYRRLSILYLWFIPAGGEFILSLIKPVQPRTKLIIYGPFVLLYITGLLFPNLISGGTYGLDLGWKPAPGPWNIAMKVLGVGLNAWCLVLLVKEAVKDPDVMAKRERLVLAAGGAATILGIAAAQAVRNKYGLAAPWAANPASIFICLAGWIALKRYGRVLSPRNLYDSMVGLIPTGLAVIISGRIAWANPSLARLLQLGDPGELVNTPLIDILSDDQLDDGELRIKLDKVKEGRLDDEHLDLKTKPGGRINCLVSSISLDPTRPLAGALMAVTDLTVHHLANEERMLRQKMEGAVETAGAISHELNQPLQAMLGKLEMLMIRRRSDNDLQTDLAMLIKETERMGLITGRLKNITDYQTKPYADSDIILDLDRSTGRSSVD